MVQLGVAIIEPDDKWLNKPGSIWFNDTNVTGIKPAGELASFRFSRFGPVHKKKVVSTN
jgi:hypothetical protein